MPPSAEVWVGQVGTPSMHSPLPQPVNANPDCSVSTSSSDDGAADVELILGDEAFRCKEEAACTACFVPATPPGVPPPRSAFTGDDAPVFVRPTPGVRQVIMR